LTVNISTENELFGFLYIRLGGVFQKRVITLQKQAAIKCYEMHHLVLVHCACAGDAGMGFFAVVSTLRGTNSWFQPIQPPRVTLETAVDRLPPLATPYEH
jgi:hypothetical protein